MDTDSTLERGIFGDGKSLLHYAVKVRVLAQTSGVYILTKSISAGIKEFTKVVGEKGDSTVPSTRLCWEVRC